MGRSNETSVIINSVETTALIDSGSMVTTISEEFYKTLSPLPPLYDVQLKVEGAGGNAIPHLGCMECFVEVPFLAEEVIFSTSFEEHIDRLEAIFSHLKQHNLKLKGSKCEFFRSEVTYLGHVVSPEGIRTDPEKTNSIII